MPHLESSYTIHLMKIDNWDFEHQEYYFYKNLVKVPSPIMVLYNLIIHVKIQLLIITTHSILLRLCNGEAYFEMMKVTFLMVFKH